jgi:hypothetical protein
MEYRIFTKEGEVRWVDERAFIQRDTKGRAAYFQGIIIDITERKLTEEALAKAEQLRKREIHHRIKKTCRLSLLFLIFRLKNFITRSLSRRPRYLKLSGKARTE